LVEDFHLNASKEVAVTVVNHVPTVGKFILRLLGLTPQVRRFIRDGDI